MKLAIITPIPIEFKAAKEKINLFNQKTFMGCRLAYGTRYEVEIICIESGPGKTRAAQAATAIIKESVPDIIVDSGTCAGIKAGIKIGEIILGWQCYEFDIGGHGFPVKRMKEMELKSAFHFLPVKAREALICQAGVISNKNTGYLVSEGVQASGEFLINSISLKNSLTDLFQATGANWETAGVYVSALRASSPAVSFRVVSDLGDKRALDDFRSHAKTLSLNLYQYISELLAAGWFHQLHAEWNKVPPAAKEKMPASVLP